MAPSGPLADVHGDGWRRCGAKQLRPPDRGVSGPGDAVETESFFRRGAFVGGQRWHGAIAYDGRLSCGSDGLKDASAEDEAKR